ncbi:MAG: dTMP kinase [Candidatus Omnitrophica bacterium]|nr:dTMP kinase [Candidatus Omnitrophota bacterium]
MAKKNLRGVFITFEGPEGCGKSTHSELLYQHLKRLKLPVIYIREPGTTKTGEKIRSILLDRKNRIADSSEMLLYMAARSQIVAEIIDPALRDGKIIISDRFLDATICYQGYGGKVDIDMIKKVGDFATRSITPDLTILLDIPVEEGLKKRAVRIFDRMEAKPLSYHKRVREGYLTLARQESNRIKVVKVEKRIKDTKAKILKIVKEKLWLG